MKSYFKTFEKVYFRRMYVKCYRKNFSILVSYYSGELKRVIVQHYKSASFTTVNANNLFDYVTNSLREDEIPITNLISNLPDSTNYM